MNYFFLCWHQQWRISTLLFFVLLIFEHQGNSRYATTLASPVNVPGNQIDGTPDLGRGYSIATHSFQSTCLDVNRTNIVEPALYNYDYYVTDFTSTRNDIDAESLLAGKISGSFGHRAVAAAVISNSRKAEISGERTQYTIAVTMRIDRYHSTFSEGDVNISKAAKLMLGNEDYINFFATCGPNYVRTIRRAQEVTALFSFDSTSKDAAQEFAASLKLYLYGNNRRLFVEDEGAKEENKDGEEAIQSSLDIVPADIKNSLTIQIFAYGIGLNPNGPDTFVATSLSKYNQVMKIAYATMVKTGAGGISEGKVVNMEIVPWVDSAQFQILAKLHGHHLRMPIPHSLIEDKKKRLGKWSCLMSDASIDHYGKCCNLEDLVDSKYMHSDGIEVVKKMTCEPMQFVSHHLMRDNLAVNGEFVARLDSVVRENDKTISTLDHCVHELRAIPDRFDNHFLQVHSKPTDDIYDLTMEAKVTVKELRMALDPMDDFGLVSMVRKERDELFEMFHQHCLLALQGMSIGSNRLTDPKYFMAQPWYNHGACAQLSCLERNTAWDRTNGNGCTEGILKRTPAPLDQEEGTENASFCAKFIDGKGNQVCKHDPNTELMQTIEVHREKLPKGRDGLGQPTLISLIYLINHFCAPQLVDGTPTQVRFPELKDFGLTPPASKRPLQLCEGGCDSDSDCAGGLKCFQRTGLTPVPGCSGSGISDHDYCTIDAAAVNAAFGKIATQSSTLDQKSSALIAVDGITVGTKEEGSVSCTTPSSTMNQWWKVDLGATFDIDRIKIFNSSSLTYQLQLNKFTVQVLKDGKIVWSIFQEDAPRPDVTFTFPTSSIVGDEVKIVRNNKNGDGVIVLSEVEVYGTPTEAKAAMLKKEEEERVASISVGRGDLKMYFKNV